MTPGTGGPLLSVRPSTRFTHGSDRRQVVDLVTGERPLAPGAEGFPAF